MSRVFRELGWFFKKQWFKFVLVLVLTFANTYAITLPPSYIGKIIDRIVLRNLTKQYAVQLCIMMAVATLIIYITAVLKNQLKGRLYHNLFYTLKKDFIVNVFKQDGDFFEKYHPGDLMNRATGDINMISNVATHLMFNFIDALTMLVVSFVLMIKFSVPLTFLSIMPLPLITALVMYLRPKIVRNWKLVRMKVSGLNNEAMESVTNVKMIRGFGQETKDYNKLSNNAIDVFQTERKAIMMQAVFIPSFRMITLISQGIALGYGAYLITHQLGFTVGSLIAFNLYLNMFAGPFFRLGNQITRFAQSGVSFDRLDEIMNAKPSIIDRYDANNLEEVNSIEFKEFSFAYPGDQNDTIENINLRINKGDTIGIVGKTGSGKTTLVKQLLRIYPVQDGCLLLNNMPISDYKKDSIRRNVAYVPQEHTLFSRTVLENLKLGEGDKTELEVSEAVLLADFEKDMAFLENGLETIVGEAGVTLSGGQKQRLSIARAFLKNADILIMDDSLSAVDGMTEKNIVENLRKYRSGRTNIICSHRLSVIENANKIIVLDNGQISEEGTHKELMANQKWYYEQYLVQQMEVEDEK